MSGSSNTLSNSYFGSLVPSTTRVPIPAGGGSVASSDLSESYYSSLLPNNNTVKFSNEDVAAESPAQATTPGLLPGGSTPGSSKSPISPSPEKEKELQKVRLYPKPGAEQLIYGTDILNEVKARNGLSWPYTPTISYAQTVNYSSIDLVHTNQEIAAYNRTPAVKLTVNGQFSAQNQDEGFYALACLRFLRTVTKMSFGATKTPEPGTPPPVLLFDAYGEMMFYKLPVIVTDYAMTLTNEVDYINVVWNGQINKVPSLFDLSVTLLVQQSPTALRKWSLDSFRNGENLKDGGWI